MDKLPTQLSEIRADLAMAEANASINLYVESAIANFRFKPVDKLNAASLRTGWLGGRRPVICTGNNRPGSRQEFTSRA